MLPDEHARTKRSADLRQRAERALRHGWGDEPTHSPKDVENLIHELQVYQIELEMQNEELRQAQLQLSASRDQYTELYDFAPVGYMTIGVNGLIAQTNLTTATLLGLPRAHLVNLPLSRFVLREDQDLLYQHRRRIFAEPQALHTVELRLTRAEAPPIYIQLESRAVIAADGPVVGYRTIISDITARKQSELALVASHQDLSSALAQLQTAQKKLVQQERLAAVGQLAAGVAHDFNNILAIISNYTALLLHQARLEPSAREKLQIIKEQVGYASHLVQQILDFSRKSTMARQAIDLHGFLDNTVNMLARTLPTTVQLIVHREQWHAETYFTNGDLTQLQQVILNLVNNARDAMPDGGTIEIDLTHLHLTDQDVGLSAAVGAGAWVLIIISDNGTGIAPAILPYIFEPFFTTKAAQGSGLGLAQVYGIMKQHGGEIDVMSQVGKGTTFTLYLPSLAMLPIPSQPTSPPAHQIQPPTADPLSPGNGETILIVDDNAPLRDALAELLEMMGYRVVSLGTGAAALELYQQQGHQIALVMTDLTMPHMSGIELSIALYQLNPQVKVIIATGYQPDAVDKAQSGRGEAIWLQKPIDIDLLRRTVVQLIHTP